MLDRIRTALVQVLDWLAGLLDRLAGRIEPNRLDPKALELQLGAYATGQPYVWMVDETPQAIGTELHAWAERQGHSVDPDQIIIDELQRWGSPRVTRAEVLRSSYPGQPDPPWAVDGLEQLRAAGAEVRVTPDFEAYASGQLGAHEIRCVLCGTAPCSCQRCATCNFTKQARYDGCPRGCEVQ